MQNTLFVDISKDASGKYACIFCNHEGRKYFCIEDDVESFKKYMKGMQNVVCFDYRLLYDLGLVDINQLIDLKLSFKENSLVNLAVKNKIHNCDRLYELNKAFKAHIKACKTAKVDIKKHSIFSTFPMLEEFCSLRVDVLRTFCKEASNHEVELQSIPAVRQIERNGIKVDLELAKTNKQFQNINTLEIDGYVYTRYLLSGTKTGRFKIEDGFNVFGIPHGKYREVIISRFQDGEICSFDYNAIDYRCIINSIDDEELKNHYKDCKDFYLKTKEIVFGNDFSISRDDMKFLNIVVLYGGSEEKALQKINVSSEDRENIISKFKEKLSSVIDFRSLLFKQAKLLGYISLPSCRHVPIESDAHEGKVLGLYAQGHASDVFRDALANVHNYIEENELKSRIIFTVHDELVMDICPEEFHILKDIKEIMERDNYYINLSRGKNYREATE